MQLIHLKKEWKICLNNKPNLTGFKNLSGLIFRNYNEEVY